MPPDASGLLQRLERHRQPTIEAVESSNKEGSPPRWGIGEREPAADLSHGASGCGALTH
jgi:hypothetical protein